MPVITHIYEAIDATQDEVYYPLGVWLTLADAVAAIDQYNDPGDISTDGYYEDFFCVEIRERSIGWPTNGMGRIVAVYEWTGTYNVHTDSTNWELTKRDIGEANSCQ